jgi:molybdenum cofactor guanylyltransferase
VSTPRDAITGCILAGGQGRRLDGVDKGFVELAGRPLVVHVLERFRPQVDDVIVSANRNQTRYQRYCRRVIGDELDGYAGPLAGFAAAMAAAATPLLATTPCDSPFIPTNMVARLWQALIDEAAEISVVCAGRRRQPVFALLRTDLRDSLLAYLHTGQRKIDTWYADHRVTDVDYGADTSAFSNVNTPEDLAAAEARLGPA